MSKKIIYLIYLFFLILSIILICLYFINPYYSGYILSCNIGASLIGAVFLSFAIDITNKLNINKQNKLIMKVINSDIIYEIKLLLMEINNAINDIYLDLQLEESIEFENQDIKNLLILYVNSINNIKNKVAPIAMCSGIVSEESLVHERLKNKAKNTLKVYDKRFQEIRKKFDNLQDKFEFSKNILLINEVAYPNTIFNIRAIIEILQTQNDFAFNKEYELLEIGQSLNKLKTDELINVLITIGFDRIVFSNKKGFLELKYVRK